jgi:hypothetical protein
MTWFEVTVSFAFKVICGCLYGYIFLHYYGGSDTWILHANSIKEKQMLLNDPVQFFWEFTPGTAIKNGTGFIDIAGLYLVDLEYCLQAKTLGIFNLISNDNYYVNVVFWNFIIFWGHFWLFLVLLKHFPSKRRLYFILIFLFPPVVFWLSGIRSDGLIFFSLSLLLFQFHHWLANRRLVSLFLWITGFAGVLIVRPPLAALLIPALLSWWLSVRYTRRPLSFFLIVYACAGIIFFGSAVLSSPGFPGVVVKRQQEFMKLKGTTFHLDTLQPHLKSFAQIFPQAAANTFLRPHLFEADGVLQTIAAIEIILFWMLFLLMFFRHDPTWGSIISQPFLLVLIFFGISLYFFIGYTIPFPGAIVRYKAIAELFLLLAMASCLRLARLENRLK